MHLFPEKFDALVIAAAVAAAAATPSEDEVRRYTDRVLGPRPPISLEIRSCGLNTIATGLRSRPPSRHWRWAEMPKRVARSPLRRNISSQPGR
ncbi:hypothetical protein DFR75_108127 [Nocardia ignorata]|uniref:Uncharacterized protein n=1 Tax=Nocardia ignorata TaxID=145285 RepID=A0A4V3CMU3_NOCIG|nr:hypothetical protein DFR75_108127 [Nocardia ignorata]